MVQTSFIQLILYFKSNLAVSEVRGRNPTLEMRMSRLFRWKKTERKVWQSLLCYVVTGFYFYDFMNFALNWLLVFSEKFCEKVFGVIRIFVFCFYCISSRKSLYNIVSTNSRKYKTYSKDISNWIHCWNLVAMIFR